MKQYLLAAAAVFSLCDDLTELEKLVNFNKELQEQVQTETELAPAEITLGLK